MWQWLTFWQDSHFTWAFMKIFSRTTAFDFVSWKYNAFTWHIVMFSCLLHLIDFMALQYYYSCSDLSPFTVTAVQVEDYFLNSISNHSNLQHISSFTLLMNMHIPLTLCLHWLLVHFYMNRLMFNQLLGAITGNWANSAANHLVFPQAYPFRSCLVMEVLRRWAKTSTWHTCYFPLSLIPWKASIGNWSKWAWGI